MTINIRSGRDTNVGGDVVNQAPPPKPKGDPWWKAVLDFLTPLAKFIAALFA